MEPKWTMAISLLVLALLAACSGPAALAGKSVPAGNPDQVRLHEDYNDALSIQGQLAAGTLLLENTPEAVDETLAAELLPLWQAVQSLVNSDTAAPAEINAVLNQIQDTMAPEQVAAIAAMSLTSDSLATMAEEGDLAFGFGGRGQAAGDTGTQPGGFPGGDFPGGGFPEGGFPGGGPGGGGPGGGFAGGEASGLDPEALATRQAEFASGDTGTMQERLLLGAVVRLLGTKTDENPTDGPRLFDTVFTLVGEATGHTVEDIRAETAEGATLAEIVTANGGDVGTVRTALIEALAEQPEFADQDLEQLADQWLGIEG